MNRIYLSGVVAEKVTVNRVAEKPLHAEFVLQLKYKSIDGKWKKERYTIHCWNRLAEWTEKYLDKGKLVSIEGCLIQRSGVTVAAREIILGEPVKLDRLDSGTNAEKLENKSKGGDSIGLDE